MGSLTLANRPVGRLVLPVIVRPVACPLSPCVSRGLGAAGRTRGVSVLRVVVACPRVAPVAVVLPMTLEDVHHLVDGKPRRPPLRVVRAHERGVGSTAPLVPPPAASVLPVSGLVRRVCRPGTTRGYRASVARSVLRYRTVRVP